MPNVRSILQSVLEHPSLRAAHQALGKGHAVVSLSGLTRTAKALVIAGLARELKLGDNSGVVVYSVIPGSAADDAGLHARDIILEVNRHPVKDVDSYQRALKEAPGGKIVLLLVKRDKNTFFIPLKREG